MSKLYEVANYSESRIKSNNISLENYVTTDSLLQNKQGRIPAKNLPPQSCTLIAYYKNDILIGNIRPYLQKIWFADSDRGNSADVLTLAVNKNHNPKFVYYALLSDSFFEHMMNGSKGSKMPRGDKNQILTYDIPDFSIEQENKIASVLSTLDAKIALNRQLNDNLEAMAKTLYDYWFVQNADKNWRKCKLSEIAEVNRGTMITEKLTKEGNIKVVAGGVDFNYYHSEYNREKNTITVSGSGANAGFVNFWYERIFASDCTTIRGKEDIDTFLIYQFLKSHQEILYRSAKGSAQPHVYPSDIKDLPFYDIPKEVKQKISPLFTKIYEQIALNLQQTQELTQLRDWLLPMLMNGQVSVNYHLA
ncbi:hypothetical protein FACS189426_03570 [Bacteroidia bacterium]|nr:hypothetical protein FACS189426_03570 [Bacteroidia bacterium]